MVCEIGISVLRSMVSCYRECSTRNSLDKLVLYKNLMCYKQDYENQLVTCSYTSTSLGCMQCCNESAPRRRITNQTNTVLLMVGTRTTEILSGRETVYVCVCARAQCCLRMQKSKKKALCCSEKEVSCKKDGSALLENAICWKVPRLAKYQVLENSVAMWIGVVNEMYCTPLKEFRILHLSKIN